MGHTVIVVLAVCGCGYQVIPNGDTFLNTSSNALVISFLSLKIFRNSESLLP